MNRHVEVPESLIGDIEFETSFESAEGEKYTSDCYAIKGFDPRIYVAAKLNEGYCLFSTEETEL